MLKVKEDAHHYLEIAEYLINHIRIGTYKMNDKIPSENELCRQFQVNRPLVRQAIARVANLGWVTPVQGKGCYVNHMTKPISYFLTSKTRFSENMERNGVCYGSRLLNWVKTDPTEEERDNLELSSNEKVYRLEIIRYVNDRPISLSTTALPEKEVPNLEKYLGSYHSLYRILIEQYQFYPVRIKSSFQADLPSLADADLLEIPENIPIVQIESLMNHPSGSPVEFSVARLRGDMQKCIVEF